jgi:hypothetical protein
MKNLNLKCDKTETMTIRQTASVIVAANAILFALGLLWFPLLLVVQGFVSVVALVVLCIWISELENDVDKEIRREQ